MFDPERFYTTDDPELQTVAPLSTLANWRYEKKGPPYHKVGKRILYKGRDLLDFIAARRVDPAA